MFNSTKIFVSASDILNLDFVYVCNDGVNMLFAIDLDEHSGISEILLRSVLKCYGDYKITKQSEFNLEGTCYEIFHTDLPIDRFQKAVGENVCIEDWSDDEEYFI